MSSISANGEVTADLTAAETVMLSEKKTRWQKFGIGLSLAVPYSASCGGMSTLTGTATNTVFYNLLNE